MNPSQNEPGDDPLAVACKLARYHYAHQRAGAARRAEAVLAQYYAQPAAAAKFNQRDGEKSIPQQVYEQFNGRPLNYAELKAALPNAPRHRLHQALTTLCNRKLLVRDSRWTFRKCALLAGLCLLSLATSAQIPTPPAAPATNQIPVTFAWDLSPSPGVAFQRLRFGPATTNLNQVVDIGPTNTRVTIYIASYPVHANIAAVDAAGVESLPSNFAGKELFTIVRSYEQTNAVPATTGWADRQLFRVETNPPAPRFTRIRQERTTQLTTYP